MFRVANRASPGLGLGLGIGHYAIRGRCALLLHLMLMCDRQPVAHRSQSHRRHLSGSSLIAMMMISISIHISKALAPVKDVIPIER